MFLEKYSEIHFSTVILLFIYLFYFFTCQVQMVIMMVLDRQLAECSRPGTVGWLTTVILYFLPLLSTHSKRPDVTGKSQRERYLLNIINGHE